MNFGAWLTPPYGVTAPVPDHLAIWLGQLAPFGGE